MTTTFGHGECEFLGIDLTGLGSGRYSLVVRLTRDYESFGVLTGTNREWIDIDVTPPLGEVTTSTNSIYPVPDGYRDSVNIALGITEDPVDAKLEVLNHGGSVIRTLHNPSSDGQLTWHGRTDAGDYAPEGQYSFRATLTDPLGNGAVYTGGAVTLSWKKLVTRTFKETTTAGSSLSRSTVGACSTLKRPSNRGWTVPLACTATSNAATRPEQAGSPRFTA
jgi:hypothetical protein